jgi:hypothetical protein
LLWAEVSRAIGTVGAEKLGNDLLAQYERPPMRSPAWLGIIVLLAAFVACGTSPAAPPPTIYVATGAPRWQVSVPPATLPAGAALIAYLTPPYAAPPNTPAG